MLMGYGSNDNGKDNRMVSEAIHPFAIWSKLVVQKTGAQGEVEAIIDMGCTLCLINLPMVLKLGIEMKTMTQPIQFNQVDESLIVGAPAMLLSSSSLSLKLPCPSLSC